MERRRLVHGVGERHSPEWLHFLKSFQLSTSKDGQLNDIDSYFEQAFYLADENPKENVIRYAVRRATSFDVLAANRPHFIRALLYAIRRSTTCLQIVVEFTATLYRKGVSIPSSEIADFINQMLPSVGSAALTYEVCWLLFWARELGISVNAETLRSIVHFRSSATAMIALDLKQRGLIDGHLDEDFWRAPCKSEGLESEMWLVAYEATRKGWWSKAVSKQFIARHKFFKFLDARDISFYDEGRKARARAGSDFLALLAKRGDPKSPQYGDTFEDTDMFPLSNEAGPWPFEY